MEGYWESFVRQIGEKMDMRNEAIIDGFITLPSVDTDRIINDLWPDEMYDKYPSGCGVG